MIAANPNVIDTGVMTQANSISAPCVKHYISCEESGTINTLADVKKAATILDKTTVANLAASVSLEEGDSPGVNVRMESWSVGSNLPAAEFNFDSPAGKDFAILAIGKARLNVAVEPNYGGAIAFYCGGGDIANYSQIKVHPYYAVFTPGVGSSAVQFPTVTYRPGLLRDAGETYAVCAVKNGDYLEHWLDGVKVGERDMAAALAQQDSWNAEHPASSGSTAQLAAWNNIQFDTLFGAGHGAYGTAPFEATRAGHVDYTYPEYGTSVNPADLDHYEIPIKAGETHSEGPWTPSLSSTFAGNYKWIGPSTNQWIPSTVFYALPHVSENIVEITQGSWPTTGANEGVSNYPQDYFGFLVCIFDNGAPADVGEAMTWMKTQWMAGNKVIYPGWVSLT